MNRLTWGPGAKGWSSARVVSSSASELTIKKVFQVPGLHPWGPGMCGSCLYSSFELEVQVLFLQTHQGTHQSLDACTMLHSSPTGLGIAGGWGDRGGGREEGEPWLEDLPNINPPFSLILLVHLPVHLLNQAAIGRQVWRGVLCLSLSLGPSMGRFPSRFSS